MRSTLFLIGRGYLRNKELSKRLSRKQKIISDSFAPFLKFKSNFGHFEKTSDPHSLCVSEIMD